jgi:lysophospholipase L1-like esterase
VYALLVVGFLAEVGARVFESQRGNLEWQRLRRGNAANLNPHQMPDPRYPGNWVLRPNYRQTLGELIAAKRASGRVLGVEHYENAVRRLGLGRESLAMRINSVGFRGPEIDTRRSRVRILALGNSVTFGTLEETTYPRLMEAELQSRGVAAEVINGGVEGYGPKHHLLQLDRYQRLQPDIITIYIGWNALFAEHPKVLRGSLASVDLAKRVLLRLQRRDSPQEAALALYHRPKRPDPIAPDLAKARAYEPSFLGEVDSLVRAAQAMRARVVLVTLTGLYTTTHAPTPKALEVGHLPLYTDNPYVFAMMVERYNEGLRQISRDLGADLIDAAVWGDTALVPRDDQFFDSVHLWENGQVKLGRFLGQQLAACLGGQRMRSDSGGCR